MNVFVCKLHRIGMCNFRVYYVLSQIMVCYSIQSNDLLHISFEVVEVAIALLVYSRSYSDLAIVYSNLGKLYIKAQALFKGCPHNCRWKQLDSISMSHVDRAQWSYLITNFIFAYLISCHALSYLSMQVIFILTLPFF